MEDIIVYGAGGFGREVHVLIKQINLLKPTYNMLGFVDDHPGLKGQLINGMPVLGGLDYLLAHKSPVCIAMALLNVAKLKVVQQLQLNTNLRFPNLIHPDAYWDETNKIGTGNILCHGMKLTCNIEIGNFNAFNGNVSIGHDVILGDFNLFGPNSFIAGSVKIGNENAFAMNSSVIQQRKIGNRNTVNMNSVLIRNIRDEGVYFGVPAIKQQF
jgi:sugar O-acyltransferase (sialic acid O-acetyltransferase NeuD family)